MEQFDNQILHKLETVISELEIETENKETN